MYNDNLKIAALMLYAGEGAKTGNAVDFVNSDPALILTFVKYLRNHCKIDENRLKFYLYCFANQNVRALIKHWCNLLKVSPTQFTKPYVRPNVRSSSRISSHGVLHVRYSDKRLLNNLLEEIDKQLIEFNGSIPKRSNGADCELTQPLVETLE